MAKSKPRKRIQNARVVAPAQGRTADDWAVLPIAMLRGDKARFHAFAARNRLPASTLGRNLLLEAMDEEAA